MGWFGKKKDERIRGTAQVVATSPPPNAATHGSLRMDLVVQAPGIPAYAHDYKKGIMSVSKWPSGGQMLPVTIDPNDHSDVDVEWDDVPSNSERAKQSAEQLAAMLRTAEQPPSTPPADAPPITGFTGITVVASQSSADPVERLTKLTALRDAGVIDAAQFEQLRQQILGQADLT